MTGARWPTGSWPQRFQGLIRQRIGRLEWPGRSRPGRGRSPTQARSPAGPSPWPTRQSEGNRMATGFGFCPNCGAARSAEEQKFCASCGAGFSATATSAAPPAIPAAPRWRPPRRPLRRGQLRPLRRRPPRWRLPRRLLRGWSAPTQAAPQMEAAPPPLRGPVRRLRRRPPRWRLPRRHLPRGQLRRPLRPGQLRRPLRRGLLRGPPAPLAYSAAVRRSRPLRESRISPAMLLIGVVLIAAICGGAYLVTNNGSKSSGPGSSIAPTLVEQGLAQRCGPASRARPASPVAARS